MRQIDYIVLHCTATSQDAKVSAIQRYWAQKLRWRNPGYHFIIDRFGEITNLQPIEKPSNGVRGYNSHSIHISYIGGIDSQGNPKDTRTRAQYAAMYRIVDELSKQFPSAVIQGHRDFKGVRKACPSFEVAEFLQETGLSEPSDPSDFTC